MAVLVASDMEPGAGVDEGRVPALQHVSGIMEPRPQSMQSLSFWVGRDRWRYSREEEDDDEGDEDGKGRRSHESWKRS